MPGSTDRAFDILEMIGANKNGLAHGKMAAPVFGWDGRIAASIVTHFPRIRSNKKNKRIIENVLRKSAAKISQKLGLSGTFP